MYVCMYVNRSAHLYSIHIYIYIYLSPRCWSGGTHCPAREDNRLPDREDPALNQERTSFSNKKRSFFFPSKRDIRFHRFVLDKWPQSELSSKFRQVDSKSVRLLSHSRNHESQHAIHHMSTYHRFCLNRSSKKTRPVDKHSNKKKRWKADQLQRRLRVLNTSSMS